MSVLSEQDPTNPQHPLHYAPRRPNGRSEIRLSTVSSTVGETHFDRLTKLETARRPPSPSSSLSAELESAVFESLRRQINPEAIPELPAFTQERTRRRGILLGAAAVGIAAVGEPGFVDLQPGLSAVGRTPDALVHEFILIVGRAELPADVPHIHLIASRSYGKLRAIKLASRGRAQRAVDERGTQACCKARAGLRGQASPVSAVA